ncbi:NAD(+)/NADH kinase [Geobacter pelophilus]|jgi:NAD+ kinase|uniref:NAD kinase n=1 Tax=Geoanaerobacter pelophilus TaxID=60036 RepID=A0AAW4LAJ2_9BACT|nr:NAD(+)/NADH kinase [Geoanaerobacter pelophilus]MBT0665590.1 NAD(+)/NADH kinase [Geoanaerobacter pelophilus]
MKRVAIIAKVHDPRCQGIAGELIEWLSDQGVEPLVEAHLAHHLLYPKGIDSARFPELADLVVVLGGDGTLISAARLIGGRDIPILGVNLGSLGFMTEITVPELYPMLSDCLRGDFNVSERMMLDCTVERSGDEIARHQVLNDVVINKGALARIVDLDTRVNSNHLTTFKADGLIISTPTGSTGYSLSAGGPIIHPSLHCIAITPICPHTLTNRPIIVAEDSLISITVSSLDDEDVYLTLDGQVGVELKSGDLIHVSRAQHYSCLVMSNKRDFFEVLRTKLKWGER